MDLSSGIEQTVSRSAKSPRRKRPRRQNRRPPCLLPRPPECLVPGGERRLRLEVHVHETVVGEDGEDRIGGKGKRREIGGGGRGLGDGGGGRPGGGRHLA